MTNFEKTVFISYRRANMPWALAIYQYLHNLGYDVFIDYECLGAGDFEHVIFENIRSRTHFLLLVTPSALGRCSDPQDWLRREIEVALDSQRNIVPLVLEGSDFASPEVASQLIGNLERLKRYNALKIPADFFTAAMLRLHEKFLSTQQQVECFPISQDTELLTQRDQNMALLAPAPRSEQMLAQEYFECADVRYRTGDLTGAIDDLTIAIRLDAKLADAYSFRAEVKHIHGDMEGAIEDFTKAIQSNPHDAESYIRRAAAFEKVGQESLAINDCDEYLQLMLLSCTQN